MKGIGVHRTWKMYISQPFTYVVIIKKWQLRFLYFGFMLKGDGGGGSRGDEKGAGSVRLRRKEKGREAGYPRWWNGKLHNFAQFFVIEKEQRGGSQQK